MRPTRGGRLAFARLGRRHPGDADELAVRAVREAVDRRQRDLRLVAAVGLDLVGPQSGCAPIASIGRARPPGRSPGCSSCLSPLRSVSVTDGRRGELGDEPVLVEALERERRDQVRRAPGGDQLGERRADDRRRLESVRAPAGADVEAVDLGLAEDRAVVGAEVASPAQLRSSRARSSCGNSSSACRVTSWRKFSVPCCGRSSRARSPRPSRTRRGRSGEM